MSIHTDHAQQMLRPIDLAHFLLRTDLHMRTGDVLVADAMILWALKSVQELATERTVEIKAQSRCDSWQEGRCAWELFVLTCPGLEFLKELVDGGGARKGDKLERGDN